MTGRPLLSMCLIAKNEAKNIERCFSSWWGDVDEVVLVDTGSTDGTLEVAQAFADAAGDGGKLKTAKFEWIEDFAAARQRADDLATGHWLTWCDLDDTVTGMGAVRKAIVQVEDDVVGFVCRYDYQFDEQGSTTWAPWRARVVRAGIGSWQGRVHEVKMLGGGNVYRIAPEIAIWTHFGRSDSAEKIEHERRDLRVLRKWLADEPNNGEPWRWLGLIHQNRAEHDEAVNAYTAYLRSDAEPDSPETRAITRRSLCETLLRLGRVEEARRVAVEGRELWPFPATYLTLAECAVELGESQSGFNYAQTVLTLGKPDNILDVKPFDYTVKPRAMMAFFAARLGRFDEAVMLGEQVLQAAPDNQFLAENLPNWRRNLSPEATGPVDHVVSHTQHVTWSVCTGYQPGTRPHVSRLYRLTGCVNVEALERAFGELVRRHEILRTFFVEQTGKARAVMSPSPPIRCVVEIKGLDREREDHALRCAKRLAGEPFELQASPLWRAVIFAGEDRSLFSLTMHELICDSASVDRLVADLGQLYAASCAGRLVQLPEVRRQFRDFAVAEREWRSSPEATRQAGYWLNALDGAPLALESPSDDRAIADGGQQTIALPKRLCEHLREFGGDLGVVYLAGFFALLHSRTGETDLVVVNRVPGDGAGEIGVFERELPLRVRLDDSKSFRALVEEVHDTLKGALANAAMAPTHTERLVRGDGPRGLWSLPVSFSLRRPANVEFAGLDIDLIWRSRPGASLALEIDQDQGGEATATLVFDAQQSQQFHRSMLESYVTLLHSCADHPDTPIAELDGEASSPEHHEPHFRGFRLDARLKELETRLAAHPAVRDAAGTWDAATAAVVAYLRLEDKMLASPAELNRWITQPRIEHLRTGARPVRPILPSRYLTVKSLPLTADSTPEPLMDNDPSPAHSMAQTTLASIWTALLGCPEVDRQDNFFALGGDLTLGVEMTAHARARGIPLTPQQLLTAPTITELAAAVSNSLNDQPIRSRS